MKNVMLFGVGNIGSVLKEELDKEKVSVKYLFS